MVTSPDHEQISSKEIASDWCKIHFPRDLRGIPNPNLDSYANADANGKANADMDLFPQLRNFILGAFPQLQLRWMNIDRCYYFLFAVFWVPDLDFHT